MTVIQVGKPAQEIAEVKVSDMIPGKFNPRKINRDDQALKDLAQSITEIGLLQPLVVRPHPKQSGKWEILAGERRWHALQIAGIETARVVIYESDDVTASAITVVENLQREQVPPLLEAKAIAVLLKKYKGDVDAVGSVLGMSRSTTARRAKLLDLSDEWKEAIEQEDCPVSQWPPSMLELIARYEPDVQDRLLDRIENRYGVRSWNTSDLAKYLAEEMHDLNRAPWKVDDEALLPEIGSCVVCPKRSDRQNDLFADDGTPESLETDARCLDPLCWRAKLNAHLEATEHSLKAEHGNITLVSSKSGFSSSDRDGTYGGNRMLPTYEYKPIAKTSPKAKPAMYVDGPNAGQFLWVTTDTNGSQSRSSFSRTKGTVKTLAQRRIELDARRKLLAVRDLHELLGDRQFDDCPIEDLGLLLSIVRAFGVDLTARMSFSEQWRRDDWKEQEKYFQQDPASPESLQHLWEIVRPVLQDKTFAYGGLEYADREFKRAKKVAELLCIDFEGVTYKEAIEAIPTPKSWAKLNEDGSPKKQADGKAQKTKEITKSAKPKPGVCRVCGCTEDQACMTEEGPCRWADDSQTICSGCAEEEGTPDEGPEDDPDFDVVEEE